MRTLQLINVFCVFVAALDYYNIECGGLCTKKYASAFNKLEEGQSRLSFFGTGDVIKSRLVFDDLRFCKASNSVYCSVDFDAVRQLFYSEIDDDYTRIVKVVYTFQDHKIQGESNLEDLVSFYDQGPYSFTLKINSKEVLLHLTQDIIRKCLNRFQNSLSLVQECLKGYRMLKSVAFTLEGFNTYLTLKRFCNELVEKIIGKSVCLDELTKIYFGSLHEAGLISEFDPELKNMSIDAFTAGLNYARDMSNFLMLTEADISDISCPAFKDFYTQRIIVFTKVVIIKFADWINLSNDCDRFDLLNEDLSVVAEIEPIKFSDNSVFIPYETISRFKVHYIKFRINYKDILIDITKHYKLTEKANK